MRIGKTLLGPVISCIAVLVIFLAASPAHSEDHCVSCHKDPEFRVMNKVLFDYYTYWEESVHESMGIICIDCHGGNESKPDKDAAHNTKDFSSLTAKDSRSHKRIALVCGKCHKAVYKHFKESKHYAALIEDRNSPNCVTCHGSMNTEIYQANNISGGCRTCHNKASEQKSDVGTHAENLLTRINFIRAYNKWITINYKDKQPEKVKDINRQYREMALSWHQFDLSQMEEKTQKLLIDLRSLLNEGLTEKKKEKE